MEKEYKWFKMDLETSAMVRNTICHVVHGLTSVGKKDKVDKYLSYITPIMNEVVGEEFVPEHIEFYKELVLSREDNEFASTTPLLELFSYPSVACLTGSANTTIKLYELTEDNFGSYIGELISLYDHTHGDKAEILASYLVILDLLFDVNGRFIYLCKTKGLVDVYG